MKHLLIIISILLLSSPVIGHPKGEHTLYKWKTSRLSSVYVWKGFGEKGTHPIYKGEVENGVPNGLGYLISPSGYKYVGSWKDGKRNGQGTSTIPSGGKYEGEYKDGKKHGEGVETYFSGSSSGEWKDGEMWNGWKYDNDMNELGKYKNGKYVEQFRKLQEWLKP
jgi:hypothetical protein